MQVALINGKGGSGKTTSTMLLALAFREGGHRVGVFDTDPQQTATRWITATESGIEIGHDDQSYNICLIDTPPRLESKQVADSIRRASVVLLVTSPSPADLFTSQDTVAVIERAGALGRTRILFNQVIPRTILGQELKERAAQIGLPSLKSMLHRRQAYQHAVLMGWKALGGEAREEVMNLALETAMIGNS